MNIYTVSVYFTITLLHFFRKTPKVSLFWTRLKTCGIYLWFSPIHELWLARDSRSIDPGSESWWWRQLFTELTSESAEPNSSGPYNHWKFEKPGPWVYPLVSSVPLVGWWFLTEYKSKRQRRGRRRGKTLYIRAWWAVGSWGNVSQIISEEGGEGEEGVKEEEKENKK